MCTLSAVHQSLLRLQRSDVKLVDPPTYIRTLADPPANRKIVLVFKQGEASASPPANGTAAHLYQKPASRRRNSTYEVTGTPLEDDCEIDAIDAELLEQQPDGRRLWTGDEDTYLPVALDVARQLLQSANALPCTDGAVWSLCHSAAGDAEQQLMLMWQYAEDWQTRGLVRFGGMQHYRNIDLVQLRAQHLTHMRGGAAAVQTHIEAHFDIQPTLTMRLQWDAPATAAASALSSYRQANVVVTQTVRIGGQDNSVADDHWRQLVRLALIKDQIVAYREREERQLLVYQSGSELSVTTIRERVQKILSDVTPVGGDEVRDAVELEPVIKRSLKRELSDITDQLWMLLKLCASYEDLKMAFNYIFLCAANCNVVNTPTSSNHLAVLIREISEKRLAVPCLSGSEPLELLLEIGLEKAFRDYEHIFTESKLCTGKEFRAAVQAATATKTGEAAPAAANSRQTMMLRNQRLDDDEDDAAGGCVALKNSTFSRAVSEQKLARLAHMHLLMEHLLSIQIHLNWTDMHDYVLVDLPRPAKPFAVYKTLFVDKRDIPIGCSKVISKVERVEPNLLKIRMLSQNHFTTVENVFVYSTTPLFPTNVFPQMRMDEPTPESPAYCAVSYLKVGTRK